MNIEIIRPYILILIPLIIALLIYSKRYLSLKNKLKSARSLILRGILITLILFSIAGISINWVNQNITTIFLVDLSDSVSGYKITSKEFIKEALKDIPSHNQVGIVAFGDDAKIEQFVTDKNIFTDLETTPITTATNLENAITTAMSLLTAQSAGRIVLITDGQENEGSIRNMSSSLITSNIEIKVLKIENTQTAEVYLSDLTVPNQVNIGDSFSVNVEVESNVVTSAVLYLYAGKELKATESVNLQKGTNKFVFKDIQQAGGLKTYKVIIEANEDTQIVNNEYTAFTTAEESPTVLLIEGQSNEGDEFARLLDSANVKYIKMLPQSAPRTISLLNEYKSIILLDVHADDLPKGFMNNIKSYIKDYAGGLIAIGGEDSFALGEYQRTVLEDVLPVYMDLKGEKEVPETAITLVIDHSGSMSEGNGYINNLDLAKEAAIKALDNLRPIDSIGVLAFDDSFDWVVPLTKAVDTDKIEDKIYSIEIRGGTSIYPAVDEASKKLMENSAKIKHIILLTDGQDGFHDYSDLIERLNDENITLSSVAVGMGADDVILEKLATGGGGRFYHTDINTDIPRIFSKEVFLSVKNYLIHEEFTPVITSNHKILSGVINEGLPSLLGYIASTKKELATSLLESDKEDPILTIWQYGLGRTAAWNSDGDNRWTANYAGWGEYITLWKNILDWTITNDQSKDNKVNITQNSSSASFEYQSNDYTENTKVYAVYTDEEGISGKIELQPTEPGVFKEELRLSKTGIYSVNIRQEENGQVTSSQNTAFAFQYSKEYRFADDITSLDDFIMEVSGKEITTPGEVFDTKVFPVKSKLNLTNILLILAILIFMLDIINRRLNWTSVIFKKVKLNKKVHKDTNENGLDFKQKKPKRINHKEKKIETIKSEQIEPEYVKKDKKTKSKSQPNEKQTTNSLKKEKQENQRINTKELLNKKNNRS